MENAKEEILVAVTVDTNAVWARVIVITTVIAPRVSDAELTIALEGGLSINPTTAVKHQQEVK